jgi:hypothetical protein
MSSQLIDPSWLQIACAAGLLLVTIGLSAARGLGLERDLIVAGIGNGALPSPFGKPALSHPSV